MNSRHIIIPLLYQTVSTFQDPVWFLDDSIFITVMRDEDYGAFVRDLEDEFYKSSIGPATRCIYVEPPKHKDLPTYVRTLAIALKFVLNHFSVSTPVVLPFAVLFSVSTTEHKVEELFDIEAVANLHYFKKQTYHTKPDLESESVTKFFGVVKGCCETHPEIAFTVDRFNSCLTRHNLFDRIVDITICLEALIGANQELSYKFALYHSFLVCSKPTERAQAFELFSKLYSARSAIVHGSVNSNSSKKSLAYIEKNWDKILRLARTSLVYYLLFKVYPQEESWEEHLKELVFGTGKRIV